MLMSSICQRSTVLLKPTPEDFTLQREDTLVGKGWSLKNEMRYLSPIHANFYHNKIFLQISMKYTLNNEGMW